MNTILEILKWTACIVGAVGYALSGAGSELAVYFFIVSTIAWLGIGSIMKSVPMIISPIIGLAAIIIGILNKDAVMTMVEMM